LFRTDYKVNVTRGQNVHRLKTHYLKDHVNNNMSCSTGTCPMASSIAHVSHHMKTVIPHARPYKIDLASFSIHFLTLSYILLSFFILTWSSECQ